MLKFSQTMMMLAATTAIGTYFAMKDTNFFEASYDAKVISGQKYTGLLKVDITDDWDSIDIYVNSAIDETKEYQKMRKTIGTDRIHCRFHQDHLKGRRFPGGSVEVYFRANSHDKFCGNMVVGRFTSPNEGVITFANGLKVELERQPLTDFTMQWRHEYQYQNKYGYYDPF